MINIGMEFDFISKIQRVDALIEFLFKEAADELRLSLQLTCNHNLITKTMNQEVE